MDLTCFKVRTQHTSKWCDMQTGAFDAGRGEYEWVHRNDNDKYKKRFAL